MATQRWVATAPESYAGRTVGSGHCVAFVQQCSGIGHTSSWHRGGKVRDGAWLPGTVIATFDSEGAYENHPSGRSHAAILIAVQSDGLLVWDQWINHPVAQRVIWFRGAGDPENKSNDGDHFYVVETVMVPAAA